MKTVIAVGFAVFGCWALAPATPVPTHMLKGQDLYMPTTVGTKWVYKNSYGESTSVITEVKQVDGQTCVIVGAENQRGEIIAVDAYIVSINGIGYIGCSVAELGETFWHFKNAPKGVKKWTWKSCLIVPGALEADGSFEAHSPEKLTVPAGTFNAVRVNLVITVEKRMEITRWYAPGIGKIREDRDGKELEVLKSFRLGPPVIAPPPRAVGR